MSGGKVGKRVKRRSSQGASQDSLGDAATAADMMLELRPGPSKTPSKSREQDEADDSDIDNDRDVNDCEASDDYEQASSGEDVSEVEEEEEDEDEPADGDDDEPGADDNDDDTLIRKEQENCGARKLQQRKHSPTQIPSGDSTSSQAKKKVNFVVIIHIPAIIH